MLEPAKLSHVATGQLAAWEKIAEDWPDYHDKATVQRCVSCQVAIYRVADINGQPYTYTDEQRLALVVAHLRQAHMDLDPDR